MQNGVAGSAALESLPRELLDQILDDLFLEDIASLSSASKLYYTVFDPLLYAYDAKPFNRHALHWAAAYACISVAQKALAGGTPINDRSYRDSKSPYQGARSQSRNSLNYQDWPKFRTADASIDRVPPKECTTIHPDTRDLVTLFLQSGADMSMLHRDYTINDMESFISTPLGSALHTVNRPFFEVVRESYSEVQHQGGFSPLTLAKLAIAERNIYRLEDVLHQDLAALDLQGPNGDDLCTRAHKQDRQDMCRLLYRYTHQQDAPEGYLCDRTGRFRTYTAHCASRILEQGASCSNIVRGDEWSDFRNLPRVEEAIKASALEAQHSRLFKHMVQHGRRNADDGDKLHNIAGHLQDTLLMELGMAHDAEMLAQPQLAQRRVLECACSWGDRSCVEWMLDHGHDTHSHLERAQYRTPLHAAARSGQTDIVQLLLRHGALRPSPGADFLISETLLYCIIPSELLAILTLLLNAGANTSQVQAEMLRGYEDWVDHTRRGSGLDMLCQPGCFELLEKNDVHLYRPDMEYLRRACLQDNFPLAKRLLGDGLVDDDFQDWPPDIGLPARALIPSFSVNIRRSVALQISKSMPMMKLLLAYGADFSNKENATIIHACKHLSDDPDEATALVRFLLDNGASATSSAANIVVGMQEFTRSHLAITKILLDAGADVGAPNRMDGTRPLNEIYNSLVAGARKKLALVLDHDPTLLKDEPALQTALQGACLANNVGVMRILTKLTPRLSPMLLQDVFSSFSGPDPRMMAFLLANGILQSFDTFKPDERHPIHIEKVIEYGNQDMALLMMQHFSYCLREDSNQYMAGVLEGARARGMDRVLEYIERSPKCTMANHSHAEEA